MIGEMIFIQVYILEMMRVFRRLEHIELGLLMRIVLENCSTQAPLERDDPGLPKLLGGKTWKTLNRTLEALIKKGVVREVDGGIMAYLAEDAIDHFQEKSAKGKRAVASRKDRQQGISETGEPQQEVVPAQDSESILPAVARTHQQAALEEDDGSFTAPFDRLIEELHGLAERKVHSNLGEALTKEEAQRQVEAWCVLGLSPEKIIEKVTQVMNAKGDARISSWKYFDQAMQAMARTPGG